MHITKLKTVALNKAVFKTRTITAVVFAVVMLMGLFINGYTFTALFLIVMIGCLYEFAKLMKLIKPGNDFKYLPLAVPYIIVPILLMLDLGGIFKNDRFSPEGYSYLLPIAVILSGWTNDTMAYIVGSLIGKTPFSKISPKKTWEGTIGGAVMCIVIIGALGYLLPVLQSLAVKHWIAIAAICALFGTLGDLLQSKLKRMAGVKDSGTFMPGHGGFLDRFDSLLIATPFVWLYEYLFVR